MSSENLDIQGKSRYQLHLALSALYPQYFTRLLKKLSPPPGFITDSPAPQADRADDLLRWAESQGGCGLENLQKELDEISDSYIPPPNHDNPPNEEATHFSSYYVPRPPCEANCYKEVVKPGSLIRIKAPAGMGKTELVNQVLRYAGKQGYETVNLDFRFVDFSNPVNFAKSFCATISGEMERDNKVNEHWDDGSTWKYNTGKYLEKFLLTENIAHPLVLALENTDLVFDQPPEISNEFCQLLRGWHDFASRSQPTSPKWKNLRLIVVHSTERYGKLQINSSPLYGAGMSINLPEFNDQQVREMARRLGVVLDELQVQKCVDLVGGHPHLLRQFFDAINQHDASLNSLLEDACTVGGIYGSHLRLTAINLRDSGLDKAFRTVIMTNDPVELQDEGHTFQLDRMGVVKLKGKLVEPRCRLYKEYFHNAFSKK